MIHTFKVGTEGRTVDIEDYGSRGYSVMVRRSDGMVESNGQGTAYNRTDIIRITAPYGRIQGNDFWSKFKNTGGTNMSTTNAFESGQMKAQNAIAEKLKSSLLSNAFDESKHKRDGGKFTSGSSSSSSESDKIGVKSGSKPSDKPAAKTTPTPTRASTLRDLGAKAVQASTALLEAGKKYGYGSPEAKAAEKLDAAASAEEIFYRHEVHSPRGTNGKMYVPTKERKAGARGTGWAQEGKTSVEIKQELHDDYHKLKSGAITQKDWDAKWEGSDPLA